MRSQPFLKNNKKECFLALDIGTEAVKALVFEKSFDTARDRESYSILSSSLQYFDESRPFDNNKTIFNVKEEALAWVGKNPAGLLMSFPPDILKGRVQILNITRQKPGELITQDESKRIIELVLEKAEKEITECFAKDSGILPQEIKFIDNAILEIKIDGYEVPVLSGYSGKNLEFKVLASFLPKGYFEDLGKVFNGFDLKLQKIINPIKNLTNIPEAADGVFIDIGGEITQVCLIRNGKMEMIDEFAVGGKDFSRVISQTLGMRFQEARLFKERYSRCDLTDDVRQRIKEILDAPLREWKSGLKSKLKTVKGLFPSAFFLFGGGSQLPEIEELMQEDGKEIKLVYPKYFKDIIDNNNCANSPQFINSILLFYG